MDWNAWIQELTTWGSNSDLLKYSLFTTVITTIVILICAKIIKRLLFQLIEKRYKGANKSYVLRFVGILIYSIAAYGFLDLLTPFETILKTLLASGGVIAVVLGLAAQEAAGNFINGLMITIFKPFKIGDLIKVNNGELTGIVCDISIRHTVIQTYENTKIIVPNSVIDKAVLENVTTVGNQKGNFLELEISYESDLDLAMRIIQEEVMKHPNYIDVRKEKDILAKKPPVITRLIAFEESGMKLKTTVYSKNQAEGYALLSDLRIAIKKRFDASGIDIPYPHRTIVMKEYNENTK